MDPKIEYKDDFVANLKERFQKNNLNQNEEAENILSNNNISSNEQNNQDLFTNEEFGFKLGKLETKMQYCEAKINNENSERDLLEQRFESKLEYLLKDIDDLKNGYKSMTKLFTDSFSKIKTTLLENIDNKAESINHIISEINKKVNNLEEAVFNKKIDNNFSNNNMIKSVSNSYILSTEPNSNIKNNNISNNNLSYNYSTDCLSKRVDKLETAIYKNNSYPGREEEINTGLTKISYIERKLDNFLENYEKDMSNMVSVMNNNDGNINELLAFKNIINDKIENLHKDFVDTSKNNNKFNYQTTILLNETQRKLEAFDEFYKKNINEFQNLKDELNKNSSSLNHIKNIFQIKRLWKENN